MVPALRKIKEAVMKVGGATTNLKNICTGILVDGVCRVTRGLIHDEQGDFRAMRRCVDQIFTLKQIGEKAR